MAPYDAPQDSVEAAVTSVPTDIPSDFMYRIPRGFHEYIVDLELDLDALRLLHALIHATCREVPNWYRSNFELTAGGHARACVAIKTLLGTAAANDNRSLTRGAETLRQTWFFDVLSFEHRSRVLRWKFSDMAKAWLFRDDEYGVFDIRRLADLRNPLALRLHTEVGLVRRMLRPRFAVSVPDLCEHLRTDGTPSWARLRKPVVGSLQKIAARERMRFLLFLHWQYVLPGIDTIVVRVETVHSQWRRPQLFKRPKGRGQTMRALVIDGATVRDFALEDLPDAVEPVGTWRARLTS